MSGANKWLARVQFSVPEQAAVVERSCAALGILQQNVFAAVGKELFSAMEVSKGNERVALAESLGQLTIYQGSIERISRQVVLLAYLELTATDIYKEITEQCLQEIQGELVDPLDLFELFAIPEKINEYTNRNRPLLIYLSAQLHSLFKVEGTSICCNPLSPNVLLHGFIIGLRCVPLDIALKKQLYIAFENEFLAQLPSLLNNIINRLEVESLSVSTGIAFDENNPGPVISFRQQSELVSLSKVQTELSRLLDNLKGTTLPKSVEQIMEVANEDSPDSAVECLSLMQKLVSGSQALLAHQNKIRQETGFILSCRHRISDLLNESLQGVQMPQILRHFFTEVWQDVLCSVLFNEGAFEGEEVNKRLDSLLEVQRHLLDSVLPIQSIEEGTNLSLQVPVLVRVLRFELEEAGVSNAVISAFLSKLKELHFQNLQQQLSSDDYVAWQIADGSVINSSRLLPQALEQGVDYSYLSEFENVFSELGLVA